ncbi:MAG: chorismate mutase [Oscillospiraceae bacterium]|nr:chorismate mutase [Oscillospiraceae bacterium]
MELDLSSLRGEINEIDMQMLSLFEKRMEICRNIAVYKKEKGLPIYQDGREKEIINNVRINSPYWLSDASAVLFSSLMDISKCLQAEELTRGKLYQVPKVFDPAKAEVIACQGTSGAYSEQACIKQFGKDKPIRFMTGFADVAGLVESGRADFGILPLENSTVGTIEETYALLAQKELYINSVIRVEITHCLAAKPGTDEAAISKVFSKKEALAQCSEYIKAHSLIPMEYSNTALAAEMVKSSPEDIACICSKECAENLGLKVIDDKVANAYPNFTRFICFSKEFASPDGADTIAVSFTAPHTPGGLYRTLTKFAVNGLNLTKIVSMPVAGKDFDVQFFLDFEGSYTNRKVVTLLDDLSSSMSYFRFLGNFSEI